jgi:SAM-dependent methyltransferase
VAYRHPLAWLLGLEGVALLRAHAGDAEFDEAFVQARLAEVRAMLAADAADRLGPAVEFADIATLDGYRIWSDQYDTEANPLIAVEQPLVRAILETIPAGRALDAACGTGRHTAFLAGRGHQVTGVDVSPPMLARARMACARLVVGELERLPLPDGAFDLVVCALALVHVPDLSAAVGELARVLRPGGHLVISDIHVASLYLGGVPAATRPDGRRALMPVSRWLASDYLNAALPCGLRVKACAEPPWPHPEAGGPLAHQWCPEAAVAAYSAAPAAIVWHFHKEQPTDQALIAR